MRLFISHNEAFAWAYRAGGLAQAFPSASVFSLHEARVRVVDVRRATEHLTRADVRAPAPGEPGTLLSSDATRTSGAGMHHVLVPHGASRKANDVVMRHRWSAALTPDSFLRIGDGIYMSRPEFAWLQMARDLPLAKLIIAGCALCASYRIDETGDLMAREPAMSPTSLSHYVSATHDAHGIIRARQALPYVVAGAESPTEIATYALMCLPTWLGGLGLPIATLNYTIEVRDQSLADRADRKTFRIDLGWPSGHVGIEYLGRHHDTQVRADRARMNALTAHGERVLQVTYDDLVRPSAFLRLARQACALLGVEPPHDAIWEVRNNELLGTLFGPHALCL